MIPFVSVGSEASLYHGMIPECTRIGRLLRRIRTSVTIMVKADSVEEKVGHCAVAVCEAGIEGDTTTAA